jgi:HK97 family phage major capsid protein
MDVAQFNAKAAEVRKLKAETKDVKPTAEQTSKLRASILESMKAAVKQVENLRTGSATDRRRAVDISFADYAKEQWSIAPGEGTSAMSNLYAELGINPSSASMESLMTMPEFEEGFKWLVPEIIREAVRLGLRRNAVYPGLIAAEETVTQPRVTIPQINMSAATPRKVGEAESIPLGAVSFAQKTVDLFKVGIGLTITDEVRQYASLNLLALFLQDVGVKLNTALDTLAIDTLINGDGNGNSAPVIGVKTTFTGADATGFQYRDFLRAWLRLGRLGRLPSAMLGNEEAALDVMLLKEFQNNANGSNPQQRVNLDVRTSLPTTQGLYVHGAMVDDDQMMLVDATSALIKLNAQALKVESERIVSKQVEGSYVTLTTGFANLFDDARVIIDRSLPYASNGFPSWMNIDETEFLAYTSR